MEKSRTEYSTMNTVVAMISRIAAILMGFVTRVVFTHTLSESYVGINGLFTDILNVLSLTELQICSFPMIQMQQRTTTTTWYFPR